LNPSYVLDNFAGVFATTKLTSSPAATLAFPAPFTSSTYRFRPLLFLIDKCAMNPVGAVTCAATCAPLTYNPDKLPGLGPHAMRDLFRKYRPKSNEDVFQALERVAGPGGTQKAVGKYWARMAFADIGHKHGPPAYASQRARLDLRNLEAGSGKGNGSYVVKAARAPRYLGASITPLKVSGAQVAAQVTAPTGFMAHLSIRNKSGRNRYVELVNGAGKASVAAGEEVSLVVANTPAKLSRTYDGFKLTAEHNKGLSFQVKLSGATA